MLRRLHGRFLRYQVPQLRRPHVFPPGNPQLRMRVLRDERTLGRRRGGARFHREVPPSTPSNGKRYNRLPQVSRLEPPKESDWYFFKPYWRNMSLAEWILNEDPATAGEFERATTVSIPCPFCGAAFEGNRPRACSNARHAEQNQRHRSLQPGTFSKYLSIRTGSEYIPDQAIPCRISEQQARANARELVRQHPDLFAGHSVEDAIDNQMVLAYAAVSLADLRIIASYPARSSRRRRSCSSRCSTGSTPKRACSTYRS